MNADAASFAEALALHQQGRWPEAEARYRLGAGSGHVQSAINLSVLLLQQGRAQESCEFASRAVELAPETGEAWVTLGTTLATLKRTPEAIAAYEGALALESPPVEAHYGLGCVLEALDRVPEALACYRRALTIDPDYAEAEVRLGELLARLGRPAESVAAFRRALNIDPSYADARRGLVRVWRAQGQLGEAESECRRLLADNGDRGSALAELAATLTASGRHAEAIETLREAVRLYPTEPEAHRRLALSLAELGDLDGAVASLEGAIALKAEPAYFRELTSLRRGGPSQPLLQRLGALAENSDALDPSARVQLHFALGRALSESGEPEAGFRHLMLGNTLHRSRIRYDEVGTLRLLERIRDVFTAERLRRLADEARHCGQAPIFIVGMPRCGSTLVEQVLASHPKVYAAGESTAFGDAVRTLGPDLQYPELIAEIRAEDLERLAERYLSTLVRDAPEGVRTTDKMLANSLFLGLIHLALPAARLVYVRRDAVDICLSCFAELFTPDQPFAYDLQELGRYYRAHQALMDHWKRLLPRSALLEVCYEDLIADFETVARRLLAHCGLDWDERVRDFHRTRRRVATASLAQVRQPLYRRARWHPDEATLAPLRRALAGM